MAKTMPGVIVDIGTGDGKFVHNLAREFPDRFIIGIDPNAQGMEKLSGKVGKKPERGGVENALYVVADVANLPTELNAVADQVFINLPWGSLLQGIVLGDETTWKNIRNICKPGAIMDILCGYSEQRESAQMEQLGMPPLYEQMIQDEMIPKIQKIGFHAQEVSAITADRLGDYPSTWAKKLQFRQGDKVYHIRLIAV